MRTPRALAAVGAGFAVGAAIAARRRSKVHAELHYTDGSMVVVEPGTPAADALFHAVRDAVAAARR